MRCEVHYVNQREIVWLGRRNAMQRTIQYSSKQIKPSLLNHIQRLVPQNRTCKKEKFIDASAGRGTDDGRRVASVLCVHNGDEKSNGTVVITNGIQQGGVEHLVPQLVLFHIETQYH